MSDKGRVGTVLVIVGVFLVLASMFVFFFVKGENFTYTVISFSIFGGGFGLLGDGLGRLNMARIAKKDPEKMKEFNIEKNDERNISIDEKARAKAFSLMIYLFSIVLVVLAIMRIDIKALFIVLAAYMIVLMYCLIIKLKLYREM